jgi:predicted acyltransferase (DUF342 family)
LKKKAKDPKEKKKEKKMADMYSQLGKSAMTFYDGLPKGSLLSGGLIKETEGTVRSVIVSDIGSSTPSFTFQGTNTATRVLLRNVAEPVSTADAATKYYVDSVASGLTVKGAVAYRTMGPIAGATYDVTSTDPLLKYNVLKGTGTLGALAASVFDVKIPTMGAGLTATLNDVLVGWNPLASHDETVATRFLVMNQANEKQNGVYYLYSDGSSNAVAEPDWELRRSANFNDDPTGEIKAGSFVFVTNGEVHTNHGFVLIADSGTRTLTIQGDSSANNLHFEQFSGAGQLKAGSNIVVSGDKISVTDDVSGLTSLASGTIASSGVATLNSLGVTNAATIGTTLKVTGATTLDSTCQVSGIFTAKQDAFVTGELQLGTVTGRSEKLRVEGSVYATANATIGGVLTASGSGRSEITGSALVGAYAQGTEPLTSANSKLAVSGAAYVHGTFVANAAATLSSTLEVVGAMTATDTSTFKKKLTAEMLAQVNSLVVDTTATITGAATLGSTLLVTGAATLSSTLLVTGNATLGANLAVTGDATIDMNLVTKLTSRLVGRVEIGNSVGADVSLYNSVAAADRTSSKLGVKGDVWVDNKLRVMDACVLSKESAAKTDIGETTITGDRPTHAGSKLRVAGSAFLDNSLYVTSNATVGVDASIGGKLTVTGQTALTARTDIGTIPATDVSTATLAVYGDVYVRDATALRGATTIGSAFSTAKLADAAISGAKLAVNGSAYVENHSVVGQTLTVIGDTVLSEDLTLTGTATLSSSAVVIVPAATVLGVTTAATMAVNGDTTFLGSTNTTLVNTLLNVANTATFTSPVDVKGTFTVGTLTADQTSTLYGPTTVNGDLTVKQTKKLVATGLESEVGLIRFGKTGDNASIKSSLASGTGSPTITFGDNNLTTTGDVTCVNVSASHNISATNTGTFANGCYSTSFYATSDARLKREVATVPDALATCAKLRGVTFKWIAGDDQRDQLGVIAQETQAVFPSLVSEHEGYLRVDYPKLVGLLIEAVKELDVRTRPVSA